MQVLQRNHAPHSQLSGALSVTWPPGMKVFCANRWLLDPATRKKTLMHEMVEDHKRVLKERLQRKRAVMSARRMRVMAGPA